MMPQTHKNGSSSKNINYSKPCSKATVEFGLYPLSQGSGNSEIWIGPADDNDVINEPISKKKKKKYNITCHEN